VITFVAHLGYLAYVRHTPLAGAITLPRGPNLPLVTGLAWKRATLFLKSLGPLLLEMLKIVAIGSLVWLPIFLFGLIAPPVSAIILLIIFIAKRRSISGRLLNAFRLFKARLQRSAGELLELDHRKPILFLRSFVDDNISTRNFSGRVASVILGAPVDSIRLEECAVDTVFKLGPVIALNRSGSQTSLLGAAKENISGDWKEPLLTYLRRSKLVIAIYGTTEGIKWEISEILRQGYGDRLILIVPPKSGIDAWEAVEAFHDSSVKRAALAPGERILALARDRTTGVTHAVAGVLEDEMSYTLAARYCLSISAGDG
jgi:hypothetical protein